MKPELAAIQKELKKLLKAADLTYEDVANKLDVSQITVKRMLNRDEVSITRLISICDLIGVSFYDLVTLSKEHNQYVYQYSIEQERLLAKDKSYFLIFRSMLMGHSVEEIQKNNKLDIKNLNVILNELEKCGLIERHQGDRIRLLAHFPFKWQLKGPLEMKYGPEILKKISEYTLSSGLNNKNIDSLNHTFEWALSNQTQKSFYNELTELYEKYRSYAQVEINNLGADFVPTTGLITVGRFSLWD